MAAMAGNILLLILVLVGGVLVHTSFAMPPVAAGRVMHLHASNIHMTIRSKGAKHLIADISIDGARNLTTASMPPVVPGAPIKLLEALRGIDGDAVDVFIEASNCLYQC
jgi:hypothetical protein